MTRLNWDKAKRKPQPVQERHGLARLADHILASAPKKSRREKVREGTYKGGFHPMKFFAGKGVRACVTCGTMREAVWITAPVRGEMKVFTMCGQACRDSWWEANR